MTHSEPLSQILQAKLDSKTKPLGSLGRLEQLAHHIGMTLGTASPELLSPQLLICAGDHGLVAQGISAYPSEVTWQMVMNFLAGGAAVSVLARQHGLAMTVVDCGVNHDFAPHPWLRDLKVAKSTADASVQAAMSADQCAQAISNGESLVASLPGNVVLLGEMGIGNTSAASLLLARLADLPIAEVTGAGTGLSAEGIAHKRAVLQRVLALHADAKSPTAALAAMGGYEIATLVGITLAAAQARRVIVVDGFIASVAVLVASKLSADVLPCCIFSHRSGEIGHQHLLDYLGVSPLLDFGLRLGEGSGAALVWPLLQSACLLLTEMASFDSAGVATASAAG